MGRPVSPQQTGKTSAASRIPSPLRLCETPSHVSPPFLFFNFITTSIPPHRIPFTMPSESLYPAVEIPNVSLWDFLFERKDKPFPDDKRTSNL